MRRFTPLLIVALSVPLAACDTELTRLSDAAARGPAFSHLPPGHTPTTLCHNAGRSEVTITVPGLALDAHLAHGDQQGPCGVSVCPFEPFMITLTNADPVTLSIQITTAGQDVNFASDDGPGVLWALTEVDGTVLLAAEAHDDRHSFLQSFGFGEPGFYHVIFHTELAGTVAFPSVRVNLACDFEAPQPF